MLKLLVVFLLAALFNQAAAQKFLTNAEYEAAAQRLGVHELALLKAVDTVESGGSGFLSNGKPKILFERHLFREFTSPIGEFDASHPQISNRVPGGYFGGAAEYTRFDEAYSLDHNAAIKATSWGRYQILGEWYSLCGYATPQAYMDAMGVSESRHLDCFVDYLKHAGLVAPLNEHRWASFARGYNGPSYGDYDVKLENAYKAAVAEGWNNLHAAPGPAPAPPAPAPHAPPPPPASSAEVKCVTASGGLHLRSAATTSAKVLATIPQGHAVTLLGGQATANGLSWSHVSWAGMTGWAAQEYLGTCSTGHLAVETGGNTAATAATTAATAATTAATAATTAATAATSSSNNNVQNAVSSSSSSSETGSSSSSGVPAWVVVLCAIGGMLVGAALVVAVVWLLIQRQAKQQQNTMDRVNLIVS